MKTLSILLVLFFAMTTTVKADTWLLPVEKKYCSENKKFCLKVQPKKLESQLAYFEDKVDGKENAGADKQAKTNYCKGIFYSRGKKLWKIQLDNEVSPVSVIVSNDGDYVITFDNWHGTGYGDNVVAIYNGENGTLIKKLSLSDFLTESDIYSLPHSTSSIQWSGEHQINYEKNQLVLKVVKPSKTNSEYFNVHINLNSGAVLDEKIDRIPSLQFLITTKETDGNLKAREADELVTSTCQAEGETEQISSSGILKKILVKEIPEYPPAAKAVRATGTSVFKVIISEQGEVECINSLSGHPLLRATLINAIKKWKFEKSKSKYTGQIVFEGRYFLVLNGKVIE